MNWKAFQKRAFDILLRIWDFIDPSRTFKRKLLLCFIGCIGIVIGLGLIFVRFVTFKELETNVQKQVGSIAGSMSNQMDRFMFERYQQVLVLGANFNPANYYEMRKTLDLYCNAYPVYSWFGFANVNGTVIAAGHGLLENVSVAARPWFKGALHGPFVGDVHLASLLQQLIGGTEILRFVDVATPIYYSNGVLAGVLGAHLSWNWAKDLSDAILSEGDVLESRELFVLSSENVVLLTPPGYPFNSTSSYQLNFTNFPAVDPITNYGYMESKWPVSINREGDKEFVIGIGITKGYEAYPGLGWKVLLRQPASVAYEAVTSMYLVIVISGVCLLLVFSVVAVLLSWQLTKPILLVVRAADDILTRMGGGEPKQQKPTAGEGGIDEIGISFVDGVFNRKSVNVNSTMSTTISASPSLSFSADSFGSNIASPPSGKSVVIEMGDMSIGRRSMRARRPSCDEVRVLFDSLHSLASTLDERALLMNANERLQQDVMHYTAKLVKSTADLESEKIDKALVQGILFNVLPRTIAERLKRGEKVLADNFNELTVFFSDIVGFTPLCEKLTPFEVVLFLNEIFSEMDALTSRFEMDRIRTIGDSYFAVGGMTQSPSALQYHTVQVLCFAWQVLKLLDNFNKDHSDIEISFRMGVHSGHCVGSVIGTKQLSFDLWGDSINVASRMESTGQAGRIQVTQIVYEKAKPFFDFEVWEEHEVKGRGMMRTYFVLGPRADVDFREHPPLANFYSALPVCERKFTKQFSKMGLRS